MYPKKNTLVKHGLKYGIPVLLAFSSANVYADLPLEQDAIKAENLESQVDFTKQKISRIKEALWAYYTSNVAWPSTVSQISAGAEPYFTGTFSTPLGNVTGSPSGNRFVLSVSVGVNANDSKIQQVKRLAALIGGDYLSTSNTAVLAVSKPSTAALVSDMLARTTAEAGTEQNTMSVDLEMSNFDIEDVSTLFGIDGEVSTSAQVDALSADSGKIDLITTQNADIGSLVASHVIANQAQMGTFEVFGGVDVDNANGDLLQTSKLELNALNASSGSIRRAQIDELRGDTMDFRVGLVTNKLNTSQLIVEGNAHAPKVEIPVFQSRTANTTTIKNAIKIAGPVTTKNLQLNSQLVQSKSASAVFSQALSSTTLDVAEPANLNGLNVTYNANVAGIASFNNLTINGITRLDRALYADVLNVTGNFSASSLTSLGNVKVTGGIFLNGKRIASNDGSTLYENGKKLSDLYLMKGQKAVNTNRLDGISLGSFARLDTSNDFKQNQTFTNLTFNGALRVNGALVISGGNLYERSKRVSDIYETKSNLNAQKAARLAQLNTLQTDYLNQVNKLSDYSSRVAAVKTLSQTNRNNASSLLTSAQNLRSKSSETKNNAYNEQSQVTSLVSNVNSEYAKKRTYQTNIVSNNYQNSSETEYVDAKECRYNTSNRWVVDQIFGGGLTNPGDITFTVYGDWNGTEIYHYQGKLTPTSASKAGYKYSRGAYKASLSSNRRAYEICREPI
ncbi:hypothetical protein [Vibrio parahaemolyticus]|uniref:hypothetical protein n=1 Tax=Vibrio parahaemolyticus TaxID=670 RepID=UPI000813D7D2|nr:hypothetical protein [Vibrio parahaemolyticus]OCP68397.1 hypothetical protein AKH08_16430 [Vibrio parahaemolyticus]